MDGTTFVMYIDFLGNCLKSNRDEEGAAELVENFGTAGNVSNYFLVTVTTDVEF